MAHTINSFRDFINQIERKEYWARTFVHLLAIGFNTYDAAHEALDVLEGAWTFLKYDDDGEAVYQHATGITATNTDDLVFEGHPSFSKVTSESTLVSYKDITFIVKGQTYFKDLEFKNAH